LCLEPPQKIICRDVTRWSANLAAIYFQHARLTKQSWLSYRVALPMKNISDGQAYLKSES
jgi:hypothetical protein